jgi:DnaJ-class molecular chaperone
MGEFNENGGFGVNDDLDCLDNDTCPDCEGTGFADPASETSLCDRCDGFGHVPSSADRSALNAQGADQ